MSDRCIECANLGEPVRIKALFTLDGRKFCHRHFTEAKQRKDRMREIDILRRQDCGLTGGVWWVQQMRKRFESES